ncbi:MAG TPA: glycosyltransferase family 4 protein [Acidimicrobiales bacterium]|nr:glycosyltransferase family 4 protein [Acidimicrobiales bacterium]
MRIGLVCPYSLTVPGGVQAQVLGLARTLRVLGVDARVLAPCDGPPPDPCVTPLGQSVPTASNGSFAPLAPDPAAQLRTLRALRDEAFDVLHVHEPLAPGPTMTTLLFRNAPMVGTFHRAGDSAAYALARPGVRWLAKRLDIRCAVSKDACTTASKALGGSYELLFNGIEVERFGKATPAPSTGPTIFFIGRHEERKGLSVLLDSLRHLPSDVTVWVGGSGPQTEALRARHGGDPRIEWLGRLSDDDVAARMRGADVFCAPSLHGESFGIVLLEAMAAGAVVVASALDGYANVATDGVDALMTPPGDSAALAVALRSALTDGSLRARLVAAAEQRAQEFSMVRLAEAYVSRYERLTREPAPARLG